MSSRLALSPADLDRLEDALEDLELDGELLGDGEADDADDPVVQRLAEFRELLQLSREALPLEDVPAGLLDGVMAEARQAAATAAAAGPAKAEGGSFWSRWRLSVWVPTLAFAGSAALLLLVLVPKGADESAPAGVAAKAEAEAKVGEGKAADGRLALSDLDRQQTEATAEGVVRGQGLAIGERAPDPAAAAPADEAPPQEEVAAEPEPEPEQAVDLSKAKRRKSASGSSSSAGGMPKPSPAPNAPASKTPVGGKGGDYGGSDEQKKEAKPKADQADDKDGFDPWTEISRADADRRGGRCGLAKMRYDKLRKSDDSRVRARALAGLGLCEATSQNMGTAKKLFDQARAADGGVDGFIDRELAAQDQSRANAAEQATEQSAD